MDLNLVKRMVPWAQRGWGMLPAPLRIVALLAAAAGGTVLAVTSLGEYRALRERDAADPARQATPLPTGRSSTTAAPTD